MDAACWRRSRRFPKNCWCFLRPCLRPRLPRSHSRCRSRFDHPLSSRFDEMDAVVVFDNVLVPWERVFLCGDVARCNSLYAATSAVVHMMHQVVVKNVAKSEFVLGLAARI